MRSCRRTQRRPFYHHLASEVNWRGEKAQSVGASLAEHIPKKEKKSSFCTRLSCSWNWSGLPFPTPGDLLDSGIEPVSLASPALTGRFFTNSVTWEALNGGDWMLICNPGTSCISLHSYQQSVSWMFCKWRYWNLERSSDLYIPIQQGKWLIYMAPQVAEW